MVRVLMIMSVQEAQELGSLVLGGSSWPVTESRRFRGVLMCVRVRGS